MAKGFTPPATDDFGKLSTFNEAAYQMLRIHKLQDAINEKSLTPLWKFPNEIEPSQYLYGYQIIINALEGLFVEVSSKLSQKELEEGLETKKKINNFLKEKPIP